MTRILLVDDDPWILDLIADCLSEEGFDVVTAPDGQVALERAQADQPALILLDYQMPCLDAPRFATAYRQRPGPHAPIVLLTARAAPQRAAEVGADAYLGKPFELASLMDLVAQYTTRG